MDSIVGASGRTPLIGRVQPAPTCKARKSNGRGNPPGCPISGGSASRPYLLQRFTPLDTFQKRFPLLISGVLSLDPANRVLSNGAKLKRNAADGLFTKPSNFSYPSSVRRILQGLNFSNLAKRDFPWEAGRRCSHPPTCRIFLLFPSSITLRISPAMCLSRS